MPCQISMLMNLIIHAVTVAKGYTHAYNCMRIKRNCEMDIIYKHTLVGVAYVYGKVLS